MNWEQLKTILWLRWRLMRNQWSRSGGLGAVIAVVVGFGAIVMAGICFAAALLGAAFGLGAATPPMIMGIWFGVTAGFLFFWMIGLLTELQRSETIDLQKLMHLPVALGQMFLVNYLVSHFSLSIIIMVPVMLGLALGLVFARGPEMALLIPLALSMVVMITAWTYCLRGWLASMMSNPRRRRTVIMCISLSFILLAQGPNLYFNVFDRNISSSQNSGKSSDRKQQRDARAAAQQELFDNLVAVQGFIPPLWLPVGAQGLAEKNVLPALYGTLGCLGLATLGLRRAYRSTVKFYHGETGGKTAGCRLPAAATARIARAPAKSGNRFLEWKIPAVPEQSAALALATFRSLLRAPEVKMALASSMISLVIVGAMIFLRHPPHLSAAAKPFVATGVVTFSIFILIHFFANQFGFDRDGFRSLILSPADRRLILLGKNLAVLPVGFGFGLIMLALVSLWLHIPPLIALATLFQLASLLLIAGLGGNLLSILMPFRIQPGTMKPTKMPGLAMLAMFLCQMLFPLAMMPVFAAPLLEMLWGRAGLPAFVPVNLLGSALFCGGMAVVYWLTLPALGRLLQSRETKILCVVTVEVE
jgi:ABC-2 type transport system permease protein